MPVIVVIDDHPAICFAVRAMLAPLAARGIHTATNGIDAIACLKAHRPDLIILDIMLNKMDGLQLLSHIRKLDTGAKVIVYTGLPAVNYAPRALRAGASGFLSKDADIRLLTSLSRLVLQGYSCFPGTTMASLLSPMPKGEEHDPLAILSDRELTVLRYLASGLSNKAIASRLLLSNKTISTYKRRLMSKLNLTSQEALSALIASPSERNEDT